MKRGALTAFASAVYLGATILLARTWPDTTLDGQLALTLVPGLLALALWRLLADTEGGASATPPRCGTDGSPRRRLPAWGLAVLGLVVAATHCGMLLAAYELRLITFTFGEAVRIESFAVPLATRGAASLVVAFLGSELFLRRRLLLALEPSLGPSGAALAAGAVGALAQLGAFAARFWPPTPLEVLALGAGWAARGMALGVLALSTGSLVPSTLAVGLGLFVELQVMGDVEQTSGALLYYVPARREVFLGWQSITGAVVLLMALALVRLSAPCAQHGPGAGEPGKRPTGTRE